MEMISKPSGRGSNGVVGIPLRLLLTFHEGSVADLSQIARHSPKSIMIRYTVFNNIERLQVEVFDNARCRCRADALHEAAPQVFLQPGERRRFGLIRAGDRELATICLMLAPESSQAQGLASVNIRKAAKDCHQFTLTCSLQASHGVATFF